MATRFCTHWPPPAGACSGSAVSTAPFDGLPHGAALLDNTCPASVVTAPPAAFWNGSGMSTFCSLGQSHTAPASTATPITISAPTTILAAIGPSGAGPVGCEWACECVTRNRVEALSGRLLAVGRQEFAQPLDRVCQGSGPGYCPHSQGIPRRPRRVASLCDSDLLLH